jgi:uncharacterized membrane protein
MAAWALSLLLLTTGTWHFLAPAGFESIVPHFLGSPAFWVALSGAAELACAAALAARSVGVRRTLRHRLPGQRHHGSALLDRPRQRAHGDNY